MREERDDTAGRALDRLDALLAEVLEVRSVADQPPTGPGQHLEHPPRGGRRAAPRRREVDVLAVVEAARHIQRQRAQEPGHANGVRFAQVHDVGDVEPIGLLDVVEAYADDHEAVVRALLGQRHLVLAPAPAGALPGLGEEEQGPSGVADRRAQQLRRTLRRVACSAVEPDVQPADALEQVDQGRDTRGVAMAVADEEVEVALLQLDACHGHIVPQIGQGAGRQIATRARRGSMVRVATCVVLNPGTREAKMYTRNN